MKMTRCGDCVWWSTEDTRNKEGEGQCCINPPVSLVINGVIATVFPVTPKNTGCADGWDGQPSEEQKLAKQYMENQLSGNKQRMDA